ncbi:MAG: F420-0:gamma-glutamyl ligase [Nitrososphaeraceae archaeon]|jgi:coenzyme F420-0:L-glutamate ligase/coenzyme F420-1:gamma-L-glutamate ligase|nr:F420-0:gamma-glutamyl ligase [Nitrososphaeraceae archaeon]
MLKRIEIIPIYIKGQLTPNSNIVSTLLTAIKENNNNQSIENGDIIVLAQKIISKIEGRLINLDDINPSKKSIDLSKQIDKDPRIIELILQESNKIVRLFNNIIIAETHHGFICANAGIDQSNVSNKKDQVLLLPINPDKSAELIRKEIYEKIRKKVAVVITDTFGRPFRMGQTNVAIGIAGINPLKNYKGKQDMFGKTLRVTEIAIVDEIAGAAELVMGKTEGIPIAIVRNVKYSKRNNSITKIIRKEKNDIFRRI